MDAFSFSSMTKHKYLKRVLNLHHTPYVSQPNDSFMKPQPHPIRNPPKEIPIHFVRTITDSNLTPHQIN